jgi:hypothetical protein
MDILPPDTVTCPYTWHEKSCRSLAMNCPKFIRIQMTNPQGGPDIDKYGCSDAWHALLTVELIRKTNEVGAAIESFRNETVMLSQSGPERIIEAERLALLNVAQHQSREQEKTS